METFVRVIDTIQFWGTWTSFVMIVLMGLGIINLVRIFLGR